MGKGWCGRLVFDLHDPLPILRPEKRPERPAHDEGIRVALFEPVFQVVPFTLLGIQHMPPVPVPVFVGHIFNNDHAEYVLVFAIAGALIADVVEAFPQDLDDFAVLFAVLFVNPVYWKNAFGVPYSNAITQSSTPINTNGAQYCGASLPRISRTAFIAACRANAFWPPFDFRFW